MRAKDPGRIAVGANRGFVRARVIRIAANHKYGNLYNHMKTTVELPDELLVAAKKHAAESRSTLRALIERGLRRELRGSGRGRSADRSGIRWVTVDGGLPPGVDLDDRASMSDWVRRNR